MQPIELTLEQVIKFSGDSPAAMAAKARLKLGIKCEYTYSKVPESGMSLRVYPEQRFEDQYSKTPEDYDSSSTQNKQLQS